MKIGSTKVAIDAIEKYDNIVIFHHIRPDGDCLGSQAGLAELIKINYPNKKVYTPGDNVHTFDFMNYHFDPIETIDFRNSLSIVVDASSSDRIQDAQLLLERKTTAALRIDHHPNDSDIKYDFLFVDEHYVAAAEMVAHIAYDAKWKVNTKAAEHIYLGIVTDSNRFMYSDTSSRTHKLASFLYDEGKLNPEWIYKELNSRSLNDLKFTGDILQNFEKSGRVLYYKITDEVMQKYNLDNLKAASFVNELANIENNSCWAFFIKLPDGKVRGRLRSNGPKVNLVANMYGGGGHDNAAGITIDSFDQIPEVLEKLNQAIEEWEK
ncbi:DHH family protein phosphoesterase [Mycoplasmopsis meleagridis]|uniref:DHH family protein phosphoesterase n=1 Tax=Mycoplasmopsis meleagridis ATCC 25294 TaxID=1264554 RepID=A0A0F5H1R1_9BACT|nr:bifunctional oligoribonuclease/PAP phosphatase NrnA [Mycoplasmopsis meleagridis]KKB26777.1 DHH family protein phosphoesterase [Mycoplasmopsis meleagridis ATCC 25294]OAD18107.1 DHH family protein phosphoesterase [Mycoplasmopsis meleagridis]VEU77311.1 Bifunctional oligoribonuclease and PAP phosphatase nrnA [Mycoplasmopsis meleagridis]